MLDFPLHFPGSNTTLSWTHTDMSAAVVLVALTVVMLACCGAAALVMVACCGGRRRDVVGESGDSRWLPGVGVIDYVPTSNRSSIRISLILSETMEGPGEDPNTVSTILTENGGSNSSLHVALDGEGSFPPPPSSSTMTLPAVFEEIETDSSASLTRRDNDSTMKRVADPPPPSDEGEPLQTVSNSNLKMGDSCASTGQMEDFRNAQMHLFPSPGATYCFPPSSPASAASRSSNSSPSIASRDSLKQTTVGASVLEIMDNNKTAQEVPQSVTDPTQIEACDYDEHSPENSREKLTQISEQSSFIDKLPDVPQTNPHNVSLKNELPVLLLYAST